MKAVATPAFQRISPHPAALFTYHRRVRLAGESALKLGQVTHDRVAAIFLRGVRVDGGAHALALVPLVRAPALPVTDEEALRRGEPVDGLIRLPRPSFLPGQIREQEPTEVGDVFTGRELAV